MQHNTKKASNTTQLTQSGEKGCLGLKVEPTTFVESLGGSTLLIKILGVCASADMMYPTFYHLEFQFMCGPLYMQSASIIVYSPSGSGE